MRHILNEKKNQADRVIFRSTFLLFFIFNMCHGEEKLFYENNRFVSQKMTLFSKLHQKVSKNAKISKNASLKNCGELNSKQN